MNTFRVDAALLRCLIALLEEASVSLAAKRLDLSQPAASHALKRLRTVFDDPLLVQGKGRLRTTPRARELLEDARETLLRLERLTAPRAPFTAASATGPFVISAPEYVEHRLCPVLAQLLLQEAPDATLRIRPPNPDLAERQLESGETDLRLGWVRSPSPSMRSRTLMHEDFVCVVRADHPTVRGPLTLEQYAALKHVRSQSAVPSTASLLIDAAMQRTGAVLRIALVVPSHLTIGRAVASTDLIATLPRGIAFNIATHLPLRVVDSPVNIPPLRVAMYWHERVQQDARSRWLRSVVVRAFDVMRAQEPREKRGSQARAITPRAAVQP